MERRKFTREFKLEAVRLIKDRGVSYVHVRRQSFWDRFGVELRERLAHLFGVQAAVAK